MRRDEMMRKHSEVEKQQIKMKMASLQDAVKMAVRRKEGFAHIREMKDKFRTQFAGENPQQSQLSNGGERLEQW